MIKKALVGMLFIGGTILLLVGMVGIVCAGDWPMFHHDLRHSGVTDEEVPDDLELLWCRETRGLASPPAIADGKVFVNVNAGIPYCLDEKTGEILWNWSYQEERQVLGPPTVADKKVFVYSFMDSKCCITSLNGKTGEIIWSYGYDFEELTGPDIEELLAVVYSPVIADGKVFAGGFDGKIYCLNENTGELIWSYQAEDLVFFPPTIAHDKVFVADSFGEEIYCLDKNTGELIWSYQAPYYPSTLTVVDGEVFFVSDKLYCLEENTGKEIRNYNISSPFTLGVAAENGKLFVGSNYKIYCLDKNTGEIIWNYETIGGMVSPPVVAGDKVLVFGGPILYCLDKDNGDLISKIPVGGKRAYPVVANERVFIGGMGGVCCFGSKRISTKEEDTPLPEVETPEEKTGVPTGEKETLGFEAIFAIAGLVAIAYILRRCRK